MGLKGPEVSESMPEREQTEGQGKIVEKMSAELQVHLLTSLCTSPDMAGLDEGWDKQDYNEQQDRKSRCFSSKVNSDQNRASSFGSR